MLKALLLLPLLAAADPTVQSAEVRLTAAGLDELGRLNRVLKRFVGQPVGPKTEGEAEIALMRVGAFASAVCKTAKRGRLICALNRARVVRRVRFDGLPAALLESELERRVFLRPGEPLRDRGKDTESRVTRQRKRIEDYLEREGYYGAKVDIRTVPVSRRGEVDVVVRVRKGSYVRVRAVQVERWGPLDKDKLRRRFAGMCGRSDAWVRAFETGYTACFTRDQVRKNIVDLEDQLRDRGYPEARVVVEPTLVPPDLSRACGDPNATPKERAELPARCVDLKIRVDAGPLLRPIFTLVRADGTVVTDPRYDPIADALQSTRELGRDITGFFTRPIQYAAGLPLDEAEDTRIDLRRLEDALTFRDARAADESEARLSRAALEDALATLGFLEAEVELEYRAVEELLVEPRYTIRPGHAFAVSGVDIVGNLAFTDDELKDATELAASARTPWTRGFITPAMLEGDRARLERHYLERGFSDVTVQSALVRTGDQSVAVRYRVHEGEQYVIAGLEFVGGADDLTDEVLKVLQHCEVANARAPGPTTGEDCAGNPLHPDLLDEGDIPGPETQRVLGVYAAHGYPHVRARVELSPRWTEAGPWVRVEVWQERPGHEDEHLESPEPARLGEIFVSGNTRTLRGAVLKDMGLGERDRGAPLDPVAIAEGVSRLRRTGIFARIRHRFVATREDGEVVDLLLDVEERPSQTIDLSLAVSTDNLLSLRVDGRDKNAFGSMLDLRTFADIGLFVGRRSEVGGDLRWPRIRGADADLTLKPFARYTDRPTATLLSRAPASGQVTSRSGYATEGVRDRIFETGGRIGLESRPFARDLPTLRVGIDYELSWSWIDLRADRVLPFSYDALTTVDGLLLIWDAPQTRTGQIAPFVRYTGVKNPFDPRDGWTLDLTLRFGHPYLAASETFFLGTVTSSLYVPLADGVVLATQGRVWAGATQLEPGINSSTLIIPDLTVLGGDRSVRGYNRQISAVLFGLTDLATDVQNGTRDRFGYTGAIANLELRITAARNLFLGDLLLAPFLDAGFVTEDFDPGAGQLPRVRDLIDNRELGASVGLGIRYLLPVGPISVDIGRSLIHDNAAVHVQFGHAF
jgi:outer membrane protein assembly factor BamA